MKRSSGQREKRKYPRFLIDLPLEYRETETSHARGGIVINACEGGFLIESVKDIPIGTKLNMAVLFPKWFELADIRLVAETLWKEPLLKDAWTGYRYGLNIVEILEEDQTKLKLLLGGQFNLGVFAFGPWKSDPAGNIRRNFQSR
jgi:hypothetical protein